MSSDTIRRHLVVHGKVQGVFFRDSTREKAENEGVAGWAVNRDDGAVEIVLEGPRDAVEEVAAYCRRGPASARVESVDDRQEEPEGLSGFDIR
ncbi:MAG TPA: acylphosphatase [Solirubrobacteraceae bacterium]|jgi:acylphosphatase|nr:acylphosphatase [Solirubrobacteraceae bacterium]